MRQIIYILILIFSIQTGKGQTLIKVVESEKPDFCDSLLQTENLIGKKVKIWHDGGVYRTLNKSKSFTFPSEEIKKLCGESAWKGFEPETGDVGEIAYISPYMTGAVASGKRIFILKIRGNYVGIACGYLTDTSKLDNNQEFEEYYRKEEERLRIYANGCEFKTSNINDNWNRAGLFKIDSISETFACQLKEKGIDTIMLAKYIFDNGSSPIEKAFVLWQDNGEMFMNSFYNNEKHRPTENGTVNLDWSDINDYYITYRLDTVSSKPEPKYFMSHDMGFSIQVYMIGHNFFNERLPNYFWNTDKKHVKSNFWELIYKKLIIEEK
jgi:hypothetical protein